MNWSDVISQPVFAELSPAGQAEARRRWVDEVYLPEVAKAGVSEEGQQRVRYEALTEFDNGQGGVSSFFNAAGRGLAGTASGVVGGIGAVTGNEGWRETADAMEAAVANALPVNPSLPKANFVGSALGQVGGVMLTAGAGGALAKGMAGVRAVAAGTEVAAMGSGVLSGARQGADDADQYGMTGLDYAARVALGGVTEYLTEKLPFGLAAETGAARKLLGAGAKTPSRALTFGGGVVTESLEEGASQIAQNAANTGLAPVGTDTPTLFTGVAGLMAGGAIGGAGFGGVNLLTGTNPRAPAAAPFNGLPPPAGFTESQPAENLSQIVSTAKEAGPAIPIGKLSLNGQAFVFDGAGWQRPATMEELAAEPGMLLRPLDADDVAEGATIVALDAAAQAAIRRKAAEKGASEKDSEGAKPEPSSVETVETKPVESAPIETPLSPAIVVPAEGAGVAPIEGLPPPPGMQWDATGNAVPLVVNEALEMIDNVVSDEPVSDNEAAAPVEGRAQPLTAPVQTPAGPVPIGSLRAGDYVLGPHGTRQQVTGTFPQGVKPVFQIRLSDGRTAPATADHLWLARRGEGDPVVITTARLSEGLALGEQWSLPVAAAH